MPRNQTLHIVAWCGAVVFVAIGLTSIMGAADPPDVAAPAPPERLPTMVPPAAGQPPMAGGQPMPGMMPGMRPGMMPGMAPGPHSEAAQLGIHLPLIGDEFPGFEADTTQGRIKFPDDFRGKWVILFSHPADFTPVCTTEFLAFATLAPQFKALNCQLIGLSVDSNTSHIAWLRTIQEKIKYKGLENVQIDFPLIADVKMDLARRCGMIQPAASDTKAVRAVFFIDPKAKVRAVIYYPLSNGRNMPEIVRLLVAMQTTDSQGVATPANWLPGDDVIVPAPSTMAGARQRLEQFGTDTSKDSYSLDWFMSFKKLPRERLNLPAEVTLGTGPMK